MGKNVRWGILGTARIATKLVDAIHGVEDSEAVGIASRQLSRAAEWGAKHDVPQHYDSYDALLADDEIDAVYIPLPPNMHREWTIRAAEAGKHVLCEKPLAPVASDAAEMADACRSNSVQLMDATMWVHSTRATHMRNVLDSGQLGAVRRVTSGFSFNLSDYLRDNPPRVEGNTTPSSAEIRSQELRLDPQRGGGCLLDLGWYCVRAALWTFQAMPTKVFGSGLYENGVDLNFSATMWFSDNRVASFDCGFDLSFRKWFEITGTEGTIVCDDFVNPWKMDKIRYWTHDKRGQPTEQNCESSDQIQRMVAAFAEHVRNGTTDESWSQVSVDNVRVCEALEQSSRLGMPMDV